MAVTVTTLTSGPKRESIINQTVTRWRKAATSADASGCEEIVAAPGAGYNLVIEKLIIYIGAAITVTVGSGETGPGSVEGDKIGPLGGAAGTYSLDITDDPILLTANKSLTFDASGAGNVCVYAKGYTKAT